MNPDAVTYKPGQGPYPTYRAGRSRLTIHLTDGTVVTDVVSSTSRLPDEWHFEQARKNRRERPHDLRPLLRFRHPDGHRDVVEHADTARIEVTG